MLCICTISITTQSVYSRLTPTGYMYWMRFTPIMKYSVFISPKKYTFIFFLLYIQYMLQIIIYPDRAKVRARLLNGMVNVHSQVKSSHSPHEVQAYPQFDRPTSQRGLLRFSEAPAPPRRWRARWATPLPDLDKKVLDCPARE
ncbi:hypothetical protein DFH11DRAFT_516461 [Phellopilus nigrolimitatus]|nr:hypothetical protein DFH11DRAFT_516461 [Phellopilus nigrolimitatus]